MEEKFILSSLSNFFLNRQIIVLQSDIVFIIISFASEASKDKFILGFFIVLKNTLLIQSHLVLRTLTYLRVKNPAFSPSPNILLIYEEIFREMFANSQNSLLQPPNSLCTIQKSLTFKLMKIFCNE